MKWQFLDEYISLIIHTNLSPSLNNQFMTTLQITLYYLQLTYFLVSENHEYVYRLINAASNISLITPIFIETYQINILIGVIIILLNTVPYFIVLYRKIKNLNRTAGNISKGILQISTVMINYYFLYFTWFLYLPQLYYVGWNLINSDALLVALSIIVLLPTIASLIISSIYFINFEFNEQQLRKHFSYNNLLTQLLIIPMAILYLKNDNLMQLISRTLHGLILLMQIYQAYFQLPFGFSKYGYIFNRALMTHTVVFAFSSIKALSTASPYSLATIMLIMQPIGQYLFQILFERKRMTTYIRIVNTNQQYELLYIEDFFALSQLAQKNKTKEIELIQKFSLHMNKCQSTKCQCRRIGSDKILRFEDTVLFISCLFKGSFEKHKHDVRNLRTFEIFSLKFLTFINKYKHNAPKSYQELKILFQKKRDYSFYFIQMCLLLQFILQAQMLKDEDYNINKESRVSNVKLQVSKSERSIVQTLYQMEQVKQNIIPLLIQISEFKLKFWKYYKESKFSDYLQIEKEVKKLQSLRDQVMEQFRIYKPMFYVNERTFNVQFLKFNALINLLLFNNVRKYFEMEKERKEILQFEKSMNSFEITNINFFKGEAISVKVCIAFGPNIGKVLNKVISPLIPKFFGFGKFQNPLEAFVDFTKGNINTLMPAWLEPIHDEIMQNYIRRGVTARIGKYFQTFAKLYDKTLIRCQVYLANNFSADLEDDFTMIGCLKSLEEEQPNYFGEDGKKLKNVAFKGAQHILFDVNGNIMGVTKGLYRMIEKLQRLVTKKPTYHETDDVIQRSHQKSKSENSSLESESFDVYEQKWSNLILNIDDFYQKILIWMILPFISREIESTGIEFLMNGQTPPKNRYLNLIDLDTGNSVVQNKETYLFIPEDLHLFVQQYEKVMQKIVDDIRIQSNNFSQGSAYRGQRSDYQESDQYNSIQTVSIFNEKLCTFFYDEHLKRHQALLFGVTRQSEMAKSQGLPSSRTSIPYQDKQSATSDEDSEQLKTRAEKIYQDRYSKYIEKITPQDFNPVPVVYSISYEEFRYKKNDIDHKQQLFVIELVVNEQQLLNTEKGYKKQLRETIKQTYSNYQQKKQLLEQQTIDEDSISIQGNISEQKSNNEGEIVNYNFPSHPSHYYEDIYFMEDQQILQTDQLNSPRQDAKSEGQLLSGRSRQSKPLLEADTKTQGGIKKSQASVVSDQSIIDEIQFKGSYSKLKFPEKEIAQKALNRINQRKKQQDFFNENESKIPIESRGSQQKIQEEYQVKYFENLKLFDTQFKTVQQRMSEMQMPYSYKIQKYLLATVFCLIVSYIILITVAVQQQYNISGCYDLIELMIQTQKAYSKITHGLYRQQFSDILNFNSDTNIHKFYDKQILAELQNLIDIQSAQLIQINQVEIGLEQFYDIEQEIQIQPSLQEIIQLSLASFYKLKMNNNGTSYDMAMNSSQIFVSVENLQYIGRLPTLAYDSCYDDNIQSEQKYETLLIVYMVIIFFLVMMLQFAQLPLIGRLRKNHRTLYKEVIRLETNEVQDEIEVYECVLNIFKKSIYEWMLVDFVQESHMFETVRILRNRNSALTPGKEQQTEQSQNVMSSAAKKNRYKLMDKLKKSQMSNVKYIFILLFGLIVILAYFLIIFFVIFLSSQDLLTNVNILFQFQLIQSSFINVICNLDLVAYQTINSTQFSNIMSLETYQNYTYVLSGNLQDYYTTYSNSFLSVLSNSELQSNLNSMNENNICDQGVGINCTDTDTYIINPQYLPFYTSGMKSLLTQISKIISSNPQYYDNEASTNNTVSEFITFISSQEHVIYIDYGSEILIDAQEKIVTIAQEQFSQSLSLYKQILMIFTLSVGLVGLLIIGLLGRLLLIMQKSSIDTCQASLLLISPKRYLHTSMGLLTQKKLQ